ncbi:MAG: phage protein Gp27 family protein [Candidatus Binataceae bacterium]
MATNRAQKATTENCDNPKTVSAKKPHKTKAEREADKFARQLQTVRLAVAEARVIAEETAGDDESMHRALINMVQSNLFSIMKKLLEANAGRGKGKKPPDIHAIARTLCAMNKQQIELERWRDQARSRVGAGVDAAAARVEEARASGLTPDAADKIRSALLEIRL